MNNPANKPGVRQPSNYREIIASYGREDHTAELKERYAAKPLRTESKPQLSRASRIALGVVAATGTFAAGMAAGHDLTPTGKGTSHPAVTTSHRTAETPSTLSFYVPEGSNPTSLATELAPGNATKQADLTQQLFNEEPRYNDLPAGMEVHVAAKDVTVNPANIGDIKFIPPQTGPTQPPAQK